MKNTFPLYGKAAFALKNFWKNPQNWFPLARIWFVLKLTLFNFNNSFHWQKKIRNKEILFPVDKNLISTSWNESFAEKYALVERKLISTGSSWLLSEKMEENGFYQQENQFSLVKIWFFFKIWLPLVSVMVSTKVKKLWTKENSFH